MKSTDDYVAVIASQTADEGSALVGYDGQAATNGNFSLAAGTVAASLDTIVTAIDSGGQDLIDHVTVTASQTAGDGSALVGYDGHTGSNTLAAVAAGTVAASLDSLTDQLDAEMLNQDTYEARILSQVATDGSAAVGYDGQAGANTLFSLAASQVDAALDSLTTGLDAEMKSTDDYIALVASQTDGEGSANVGYDGLSGTNTELVVVAGTVEATLDTIIQAIDDDRAAAGGSAGAGELGWEGEAGSNTLFSIAGPTNVAAGLDALVQGLDAEMKNQDDYEASVLSQTATEGGALVGYDGQAGANTLFSLSASQVDAALDSLTTGLDAEMKNQDDYEASVLSQTATEGSALVGYDGQAATNGNFSLAASSVDAALDSIATALDSGGQDLIDHVTVTASQTATEGSALTGYDGETGSNGLFSLSASAVDAALDSLTQGVDTNMQELDNTISNFNSLSAVGTSAAAFTHTITHSLGTDDVIPMIWVDDSGTWRNDIVAITNTSTSAITVELTESRSIKYAVFSMADLTSTV
jgi:hypothetical protein